jgi:DNA primase catalytic core, N-terminal domain
MTGATVEPVSPVGEIVDRAAAYFETCLWDSEAGARVRERLARSGIESTILREFRVGYAPGAPRALVHHLAEAGYSPDELIAAGLANRSERTYLHVVFHARIVFPFVDRGGGVRGFAGLATHLGPSWPLWLTSPDRDHFDAGTAIFGLDQAAPVSATVGRILVVRDCVQVLALHQAGRREAVAVVQSPITRAHLAQFAATLGAGDLRLARRDGLVGVVVAPEGIDIDREAFAASTTPAGFSLIDSARRAGRSSAVEPGGVLELDDAPPPARAVVYLAGVLLGVGMPVGLLLLAEPHNEAARGSTTTLNVVVVGLAVAYLLLAFGVARVSARVRMRSRTRRMREPWARGSDEWQPRGWTYHRLEEILVGAALASAITCVVLLMTIGGFLG